MKKKGMSYLFSFIDHLFYEGFNIEPDHNDYSQNAVSAVESFGVQLMTIHSAKGLEFKHIILMRVCSDFRNTERFQYFSSDRKTGQWALSVRSEKEDKRKSSFFIKKSGKTTKVLKWKNGIACCM